MYDCLLWRDKQILPSWHAASLLSIVAQALSISLCDYYDKQAYLLSLRRHEENISQNWTTDGEITAALFLILQWILNFCILATS